MSTLFSKALPNIKLATKFDADGNEVQVERREDVEENTKQQEIFDILVAAGYFRARIKGLSPFDKIVGGMTWCIESCAFDVDVDLLFHENLTIGQKIALTEKIVAVLPKMHCPHQIEPHQIQGLDFINIFPVIQWLVKRSVENRLEKAEKLKAFAVGQFHNYFSLKSDQDYKEKYINANVNIKLTQDLYGPRRQYKRKELGNEDEKTRVRITLLEYGNKKLAAVQNKSTNVTALNKNLSSELSGSDTNSTADEERIVVNEIDVDQLLKSLYVANEDETVNNFELNEIERRAIEKNYKDLRSEMTIDTKLLSEQSQINGLEVTKMNLEKKLKKIQDENRVLLEKRLADDKQSIDKLTEECNALRNDIKKLDNFISSTDDKSVLQKIQNLIVKIEESKLKEIKFKEQCNEESAKLHQEIAESEKVTPEEDIREALQLLDREKERLQTFRLQLAKKNRAIVKIQRRLDNIPDRTELAQYQRRFLELYNQVSAKHSETKQYFTLYNTLDDTKIYLTKELSLLNSIYETYNDGMQNVQSKEQFLNQFEMIIDGVKQSKGRLRMKWENEKAKRDGLNAQLMCLIEHQRKYAAAVKQFTQECQKNEELLVHLKSLQQSNDSKQ